MSKFFSQHSQPDDAIFCLWIRSGLDRGDDVQRAAGWFLGYGFGHRMEDDGSLRCLEIDFGIEVFVPKRVVESALLQLRGGYPRKIVMLRHQGIGNH